MQTKRSIGSIPTLFSFFSGIGFLDLGFEDLGFPISFVNEYHRPFLDSYIYSRRKLGVNEPIYGYHPGSIEDFINGKLNKALKQRIKEIHGQGKAVGFIGGPPCPDFSVGGKNRGHTGDQGRLSQTYFELVIRHKPDFFLFENVKGLWQTKRHRAFYDELKYKAEEAGYQLTDRLINAIEYGVPQDRERIILFGFSKGFLNDRRILRNGRDTPQLWEIFPWLTYAKYPGRKAFSYHWPSTRPFRENSSYECPKGVPIELTVEYWFRKNRVTQHPNSSHYFKPRAGLARFLKVDEGDDSRKSFKRLHRWRYSPTACYGNNEVHLHPYKPRRISAAEALAVQSLPKEFELPENMTLSNMFKSIGNGVPFIAARALARTLLSFLGGDNEDNSK